MTASARKVECLVIGGGVAGSMAALRLAEAGRDVMLVEREAVARPKVCGEFLSAEAVDYLRRCGVDPARLGARAIRRLRLSTGGRKIERPLPFAALALSRSALDEALLAQAAERGCEVVRGRAIERLSNEDGVWRAASEDGDTFSAEHVFLASGKHDLRGWPRGAGVQNDLIGFKMHWTLAPQQAMKLAGGIELMVFRGGYGGLVMVEDGSANFSLVVRRRVFQSLRGWAELVAKIRAECPLLDERLERAEQVWERPVAISPIPYGYVARARHGCWRVGDQAAVIPSFTGDGIAIALHSAALAVEMMLGGRGVGEYQRTLARQLRVAMAIATSLSRLMASDAAGVIAPAAMKVLPLVLGSIARATRIPAGALQVRPCGTAAFSGDGSSR